MSKSKSIINQAKKFGEITIGALPYGSTVLDAFRIFQETRAILFLENLKKYEDELEGEKKQKFLNFVESNNGKEILAEFVAKTISTSSKLVSIALALAYSKLSSNVISKGTALYICSALNGIDDELIDHFLLLCNKPEENQEEQGYGNPPYKIMILSQKLIDSDSELSNNLNAEQVISSVNELIRRRIFLPDYTFDRATPGHWTSIYGLSENGKIIREIILKAKTILNTS